MLYIDPSSAMADEAFWSYALKGGYIGSAASEQLQAALFRRNKNVLVEQLPTKLIRSKEVLTSQEELKVYLEFENQFLSLGHRLNELVMSPAAENTTEEKLIMRLMMPVATNMRQSLIHPMLADGGREWSIQFSPTRCHLARKLEQPHMCVVCCRKQTTKIPRKKYSPEIADLFYGEDTPNSDGEDEAPLHQQVLNSKGKLTRVPLSVCSASPSSVRHWAHEGCLAHLEKCPRCSRRKARSLFPVSIHAESGLENFGTVAPHIRGGFSMSAKIKSILTEILVVPSGEKAIVASFFKGTLDLLEAVLFYTLNFPLSSYARFDGDITGIERQQELKRFKEDPDCRFLLMSIQTGGTGLNIVEANHVHFADRWYNPFVHDQAEDR